MTKNILGLDLRTLKNHTKRQKNGNYQKQLPRKLFYGL